MFVWIDETGCDKKDLMRKYGYAMRGERAVRNQFLVRGKRVNAIAAISSQGLVAVDCSIDNTNTNTFYDFLRGSVIPNMASFDGEAKPSIIVMDNLSVHHTEPVTKLLLNAGILNMYLPPYSPDYNPIELTFSYVKSYIRDHEDLLDVVGIIPLLKAGFASVTSYLCEAWIRKCGYS